MAIRSEIRDRIQKGVWPHATLLPSENALASEFGVTRATIRQALRGLEEEKYLSSHQGLGRFVNQRPTRVVSMLSRLESMDKMMSPKVKVIQRLIEYVSTPIDEEFASLLEVPADSPGYRLVRIRYAGTVPAAVSVNIFPATFAPKQRVEGSLLDTLDRAGHIVHYAETEIVLPEPDDAYATLISTSGPYSRPPSTEVPMKKMEHTHFPVIMMQQVHRDVRHVPIFLARDYLNMETFSLRITRQRTEL